MKFDAKAVLAILIVLGAYVLLGIYVYQGRSPDAVIAAIISGAVSGVVAFFFGHQNGTVSALATAATQLSAQAIEKRQTPVMVSAPVAPSPPGPVSPTG